MPTPPDPFSATPRELLETVRSLESRYGETANWLEKMHHDDLTRAADLGHTLSRLQSTLDLMQTRQQRFEDLCRDMRLTLTGIGSLAKSLTERQSQHEVLLARLVQVSEHLTAIQQAREMPDAPTP
jgi:hypothetical protein